MNASKIIAYNSVVTENPNYFGEFVNELVQQGWQPYSIPMSHGIFLIQVLVKYEPNATELPKSL